MANNGTKPSLGSTLTTVAGWVSQGLGYDTFQHTNGQSGSDGYSASIGSLSSGIGWWEHFAENINNGTASKWSKGFARVSGALGIIQV